MIGDLLPHLQKVRKSGKGYTALCPVHDDSSPSMAVTEKDGKVLCHCFSCGANGFDVVQALNLPASILFEEQLEIDRSKPSPKEIEEYKTDIFCLLMEGQENSYEDWKRLRLAKVRVKNFEDRYGRDYA